MHTSVLACMRVSSPTGFLKPSSDQSEANNEVVHLPALSSLNKLQRECAALSAARIQHIEEITELSPVGLFKKTLDLVCFNEQGDSGIMFLTGTHQFDPFAP